MNLLTLKNWDAEIISQVIAKAEDIKKNKEMYFDILKNKTMVMYFEKTSTRTRLSFETGMTQLGGHSIFLDKRVSQAAISSLRDEARAIARYADIIMARVKKHKALTEMEEVINIPIINGCCERYHPCQALSDAMTMIEYAGSLEGKKLVWLGIGNNVSNSLIRVCTKLGAKAVLCIPEKDPSAIDMDLEKEAKERGLYEETTDLSVIKDADFVYTDTWINMEFINDPGFENEKKQRIKKLMPFQLNKALLDRYNSSARIMHCMPCHVGYEITRDAIDHPNSIIFDQAENRLHLQKAIILKLLCKF